MGCNCGKTNKNIKLAKNIEHLLEKRKIVMAKKKVLYRIKESCTLGIDSYFRFRDGSKIWIRGITQSQLASLYRNGFTDIEIVEDKKSKDDNKKETSK